MNVLVMEATADGLLDLAVRAQALGHSARYHLGCYDPVKCPVGKGLVEREHDWRRSMKWADLVVVGGNGKWIAELDKWRSAGAAIIGGCAPVAALELDRMLGMAAFKRKGIPLPPYRQCMTLREAIDYVTKEDRGFAVKVCGDVADKTTSIVGKDAKGTLWRLERWRKEGKNFPSGFMVQERIEGVEFAVGGWIGPGGFAEGWEENFEEKRLYAGGLGPNVGESGTVLRLVKRSKIADAVLKPFEEMLVNLGYVGNVDVNCIVGEDGTPWPLEWTCYDDKTEVLTDRGWKRFADVGSGDWAATLDPRSGRGSFKPIARVVEKDYVGEMIEFTTPNYGVDLCVTPDHAMWVKGRTRPGFEFRPAHEVEGKMLQILRSAEFEGEEKATFTLPAYTETHYSGRWGRYFDIEHPALEIPMEPWLRFLGLYISEGSLGRKGTDTPYQINIAQGEAKSHLVRDALEGLPWKANRYGQSYTFNSVQLGAWINEHIPGRAPQKRVPREFLGLSPRLLGVLLDALVLGDGSIHKRTGGRTYHTTSVGLADDVHEIITRMGNLGRVIRHAIAGTEMTVNGNTYTRGHDIYTVTEARQKKTSWTDPRQTRRVTYAGKVYCLNVPPHHLLYVRRNGKAQWCGNCRLGWPAFNIECALHGDPVEFLAGLAAGKPPKTRRLDEIAVGVVLTLPPYPYGHEKTEEVVNVPIWGVTPSLAERLHFCNVMQNGEGLASAGSYVMVATGTGDSVQEARRRAYGAIKRVEMPASPFYRIDIGQRLRTQLEDLRRHGFAEGMRFS